jgi:hypothetical protein
MSFLWQDLSVGTKNLTLWPWRWCSIYLFETLTLGISFEWHVLGPWYFTWVFLETSTFHGYKYFWPCDFDLGVWPICHIENFNLNYIFWMICSRILIFHMSVSSDKTFPWIPTDLTLWPWPWCLTYILKTLTMHIYFEWYMYVLGLWYFTWMFVVTSPFSEDQQVWPCDLDLYVWLTY